MMDDPNITMEEYIRLEEEKAQKCRKVFNWETAKYGKISYDEDVHDLRSVETEFPAIVFNDNLTSNETLFCEPTGQGCEDLFTCERLLLALFLYLRNIENTNHMQYGQFGIDRVRRKVTRFLLTFLVSCFTAEKKGRGRMRSKSRGPSNREEQAQEDDDGDDSTEVNTTTDEFFVCSDMIWLTLLMDVRVVILDSGATCHVATRKEYFSSYTPGDFGVVRMGNTRLSRIAGIGDICLKFDTGMELVLHNVKHVPDMRLNIISTGLLDEDGYHNSSGNGLWKVTLGSLIVARGKRESKLYMTHPKISKSIVNAIDNDDMTELWLKRLEMQIRHAFKSRPYFSDGRREPLLDLRAWDSDPKDPSDDTAIEWLGRADE
ncbi:retrovirus-related pol polyprotein from transposon TNT 1-94 [Tanacetum coccineum]